MGHWHVWEKLACEDGRAGQAVWAGRTIREKGVTEGLMVSGYMSGVPTLALQVKRVVGISG